MSIDFNTELSSILSKFDSFNLDELDSLELLNRHDIKYLFNIGRLNNLLISLQEHYKILEIESNRVFTYHTTYFDTNEYTLYNLHHNGKKNRFKIRHRLYQETGKNYLEVKFKTNTNKSLKSRIKFEGIDINNEKASKLIFKNTGIESQDLHPILKVDYFRVTLVNKFIPEKVTFDFNLQFKNSINSSNLNSLVIAELKHEKQTFVTPFADKMATLCIYPDTISKYCTGSILTIQGLKQNRFKSKMLKIDKICREKNGF